MKNSKNTVKIGKYILDELPSGSLRLRKMYKGVTYTLIYDHDHKPTEKELTQALAAEMDKTQVKKEQMTFRTAAQSYIDLKRNILSPSTIREYAGNINRLSDGFTDKRITDITALDVQKEINNLAKNKSPKTVRNYHGFISAVLGTFCPNTIINTTLPQKLKIEPYIPSDEDVKNIITDVKDTAFEIPIMLACFGMRRSEICALTLEDIDGNTVKINKALVKSADNEWVIKTTKTTDSTREIWIPDELADMIRAQGYVYKGHPNSVSKHMNSVQDKLNIPRFSLHKLRHYYASTAHAKGVPTRYIMDAGGWKSETVLNNIYSHALKDKKIEMQKITGEHLQNILF